MRFLQPANLRGSAANDRQIRLVFARNELDGVAAQIVAQRCRPSRRRQARGATAPLQMFSVPRCWSQETFRAPMLQILRKARADLLALRIFAKPRPKRLSQTTPRALKLENLADISYKAIYAGMFDTPEQKRSQGNRGARRKLRHKGKPRRPKGGIGSGILLSAAASALANIFQLYCT